MNSRVVGIPTGGEHIVGLWELTSRFHPALVMAFIECFFSAPQQEDIGVDVCVEGQEDRQDKKEDLVDDADNRGGEEKL